MDPRMYPLAMFVREIRQDWALHTIQGVLAELDHLPYERVAVAAVKASVDPKVETPRGIFKVAKAGARSAPSPPPLCGVCHSSHDPERPGEHIVAPPAETALRGAAAARAALRASRDQGELDLTPRPDDPKPIAATIPEHLAAGLAAHTEEEPERERYP